MDLCHAVQSTPGCMSNVMFQLCRGRRENCMWWKSRVTIGDWLTEVNSLPESAPLSPLCEHWIIVQFHTVPIELFTAYRWNSWLIMDSDCPGLTQTQLDDWNWNRRPGVEKHFQSFSKASILFCHHQTFGCGSWHLGFSIIPKFVLFDTKKVTFVTTHL